MIRERVRRERERAGPITPRHVFTALPLAALVLSLGHAVTIERAVPFPGLGLRLLHHATELAQNLTVAFAVGGVIALCRAYARRLTLPLVTLATLPVVHAAIGHSVWRKIMLRWDGAIEWSLYWPALVLAALAAPVLFVIGHWLGSFRWAFVVAVLAALATIIVGDAMQFDQYFGDHCAGACAATVLAGAALGRRFESRLSRWDRRRLAFVFGPVALLALIPPSNAVRIELFKVPSSAGAWVFATLLWSTPTTRAAPAPTPWLAGRAGEAPIGPSPERLLTEPPVVVLVTIDATRADVVDSPPLPMPELSAMKATSLSFSNVVAPGSQTAISLSAVFSGRYFSQLRWDWVGHGAKRFVYPAADPAPRFPELLTKAGIPTTLVGPIVFLNPEYGIARGFSDLHVLAQDSSHAMGEDVANVLVDRIRAADPRRPAFFYAHFIEPHHPYDRGAKQDGTERERYASEVALAGRLVERVARAADERFGPRVVLIVASDHGEAFGEHHSVQHSKTVYQEVLRVPLLVRVPKLSPRRIDEPVGIIDLGPTILDVFGLPTPPSFMGQTLVPLMRGKTTRLERPLFAEARLHRAYFGEVKVIEDARRHTVEAYDLARDPGELDNLFGRDRRVDVALATLQTFFKDAPLVYRQ